jgi:hypothetical protein
LKVALLPLEITTTDGERSRMKAGEELLCEPWWLAL